MQYFHGNNDKSEWKLRIAAASNNDRKADGAFDNEGEADTPAISPFSRSPAGQCAGIPFPYRGGFQGRFQTAQPGYLVLLSAGREVLSLWRQESAGNAAPRMLWSLFPRTAQFFLDRQDFRLTPLLGQWYKFTFPKTQKALFINTGGAVWQITNRQ